MRVVYVGNFSNEGGVGKFSQMRVVYLGQKSNEGGVLGPKVK